MNASELLANTLSADAHTRQDATAKLENASKENYPAYMGILSSELTNDSSPLHVRSAAGLALKNALSARESERQAEYSDRWLLLDRGARDKIKHDALSSLGSPAREVGTVAAQVVAAIASVELPQGQWPDVIEVLLRFMNSEDDRLHVATLQAIGFICESISPEVLAAKSNEILTAVMQGARKEKSAEVQTAAITALFNSLEFVRDNFEREGERNYIMQIVCEATQIQVPAVQVGAFECLVRIMTLYYEKMSFYMERALFGLTVMGMKHPDENIALQAIEFWSTVCELEAELAWELSEAQEFGELPENESKFFAKVALPEILPVLLELLLRQDEDADEDEWNVSMAAGTCLGLLATAVQDGIVPLVTPFVEQMLPTRADYQTHGGAGDWHHREAGVMAFGSILDGPDPKVLIPQVNRFIDILVSMMNDENLHVKDSVAWTLGRICELLITSLQLDVHLTPLVTALVAGLGDAPRIVTNSCWGLTALADQLSYNEDTSAPSGLLSPYFDGVIQALLRTTEAATNEGNYRTAAYEAITSFVTHAHPDTYPSVNATAMVILQRMEQLISLQNQILGIDDRNNWNDLQSNFCSVLISVVRKLNDGIQPLADRIMTLVLQLIQVAGKTSTVLEDAFLVVGAMASALEEKFAPYIEVFLPLLYPALKAHEDAQLCTVAIGVIGDLSRALGDKTTLYSDAFMRVLLENLQSDVLNRNVKIHILSCFGDIALAIGSAFGPYLNTTMDVLHQAGSVQPPPLHSELVEYVSQLREGILEAYTGIITGLRDQAAQLNPHIPNILKLVQRCLADTERTEATVKLCYGLIGDIADSFPGAKNLLLAEWIAVEFRTRSRYSSDTKRVMRWAKEMVKQATA